MDKLMMVVEMFKAIVTFLPKLVTFIRELLTIKNTEYNAQIEAGATDAQISNMQAWMRESTIAAAKDEFSGSPNLIPEPIIRMVYEWLVLREFGDTSKYAARMEKAVTKGYIDAKEAKSASQQIKEIKKAYPMLFGNM